MMTTKIEWTDEVWNPVTGCTKVSQGCKNCYAERIANRFWGEDIPLKWRKPRRVFVNSMSDLFHEDVPDLFIYRVFSIMARTNHTYQILTKRPKRMMDFCQRLSLITPADLQHLETNDVVFNPNNIETNPVPIPNVWLGVSVENQATADERIPWLLKTPAAVRFVSYEPALGPVDLSVHLGKYKHIYPDEPTLDWIIAGGESGPGARPAHPDWFRSVRDQCVEAGVPFFFKQWGEWIPVFETEWERRPDIAKNGLFERVGKKQAGRLLDGREWNEYPEMES